MVRDSASGLDLFRVKPASGEQANQFRKLALAAAAAVTETIPSKASPTVVEAPASSDPTTTTTVSSVTSILLG